MRHNAWYTVLFAGAVCIVCAILVSSAAVSLSDLQQANAALDKQQNVLFAAGLADPAEGLGREEIIKRFEAIKPVVVNLETGQIAGDIDPANYDQQRAKQDPAMSRKAAPNEAGVNRIPNHAVVYQVMGENDEVKMLVLPIEGYGLWSTLYGFLALDSDTTTVRGITYYQHGETPGLGGEVDNPSWKERWPGRKVYDESGTVALRVIKGKSGPPEQDPHQVDGLSGATITSRGVDHMVKFWLGENGFKTFLENFRHERSAS